MDTPSTDTALTSEAQPDTAAAAGVVADTQVTTEATPSDAKPADAKPADAATAEAKPADAKTEPKAEDKPVGAPEKYEAFTVPEGYEIDQELMSQFEPVLREVNLTQEAAQKIMDVAPKLIEATQMKTVSAVLDHLGMTDHATWAPSLKADKEIGGDKLAENLAVAKKGLETFGTPQLRDLLKKTGLGNHPEMVRAFYKVGQQIKEDGFVSGSSTTTSDARALFSASNMNP